MRVPDELRKCVAFVGEKRKGGISTPAGTGFFIGEPMEGIPGYVWLYLVTAKHVIDGIRSRGHETVLRINTVEGDGEWIDVDDSRWWYHPEHEYSEAVDLAVTRIDIRPEFDHKALPVESFVTAETLTQNDIGVGSEVFISGLFHRHYGEKRNIPIVRIGNIAAMPEEPIASKIGPLDAYLIEARSIGGISGSPVFVRPDIVRIVNGNVVARIGSAIFLLGVIHGHWDMRQEGEDGLQENKGREERVNLGIAMVTPAEKIIEMIRQPALQEIKRKEADEARTRILPTVD